MHSTETFDPTTRVIGFSIEVAGKRIDCRVTESWLRKTYGAIALDEGTMTAFTRRRHLIDAAAMRAWLTTRGVEPVWLKDEHVWRQPAGTAASALDAQKA